MSRSENGRVNGGRSRLGIGLPQLSPLYSSIILSIVKIKKLSGVLCMVGSLILAFKRVLMMMMAKRMSCFVTRKD